MYGCHNRKPLKDQAIVQDGWERMGHHIQARRTVSVADHMSKDCRYTYTDLGKVDPKCAGCKHRAESAGAEKQVGA